MKLLHRKDLYCWSEFDETRNLDFNSILWEREEGNILIDPLPLSEHDYKHLQSLGGATLIIITNSDHCRDAFTLSKKTKAIICGPQKERENFPIDCDRWLQDGEEICSGLTCLELNGSKTPGELALLLEGETLITGDLIRCHQGGELCLLPDAKLGDKTSAINSLRRLASFQEVSTVLPGDGWPAFNNGGKALRHLAESFN